MAGGHAARNLPRDVYHNHVCSFPISHSQDVWSARKGTRALSSRWPGAGLFPDSGAEWIDCVGAYAVFDGIDSLVTQTFGLGIFEELSAASLDVIERFFLDRGAQVVHEVSPLAGVAALDLLCAREYRPIEISNVMYRPVEKTTAEDHGNIRVRVTGPEEAQLWTHISARGWTHEHPEFLESLLQTGAISSAREDSPCFLAELDGEPGAAGALCIHNGVALFAGAATVPELRRRGLQGALLEERMRYAFDHGCDLAMMVAEAGSDSQRNAERKGFRIAYTRTKWRLGQ
jgi:GNAT superfamily N-acetyltransferase